MMHENTSPGLNFELVTAKIQQALDKSTIVKHDQNLTDRIGNKRQYDVTFEGAFGGRNILGVIECKDWSKKCGPAVIEAFSKKTEHLMANVRIVVSRKGFTPQALKLAKHENIGCISLIPNDPLTCGFHIGCYCEGTIFEWGYSRVILIPSTENESLDSFSIDTLKKNGLAVIWWFVNKVNSEFSNEKQRGEYGIRVDFDAEEIFTVSGKELNVKSVEFIIKRDVRYKRKWLNFSGEAFYDWELEQVKIPNGVPLKSDPFKMDIRDWPESTDPKNNLKGFNFHTEVISTTDLDIPKDVCIPDLTSIGTLRIKTPTRSWTLLGQRPF